MKIKLWTSFHKTHQEMWSDFFMVPLGYFSISELPYKVRLCWIVPMFLFLEEGFQNSCFKGFLSNQLCPRPLRSFYYYSDKPTLSSYGMCMLPIFKVIRITTHISHKDSWRWEQWAPVGWKHWLTSIKAILRPNPGAEATAWILSALYSLCALKDEAELEYLHRLVSRKLLKLWGIRM